MKKIIFITILFLLTIPLLSQAHGDEADYMGEMTDHMMRGGENFMIGNMMGWNSWGMGISWIFMIVFWGFIIWLIVILVQRLSDQGKSKKDENSALDILKERYAKGEINKNEFEEKKKDLR